LTVTLLGFRSVRGDNEPAGVRIGGRVVLSVACCLSESLAGCGFSGGGKELQLSLTPSPVRFRCKNNQQGGKASIETETHSQ
jgi:hypothetical protein